ncbi:hypothetical protein PHLCEN_2v5929 [Hermanssonia centrifuga]|uniref:Uncharacterized protein n=1 Tax=Hermanssonia centrifuga TaxID=98765 RepID=A0A2R6P0V2_9APHY|nr:hypothetical protein PHLCEN_2v5929 [Hermanssonia centrifuga]
MNLGIPPMSNPPPPSTFTLPELDPMYNGQEIYLSVAEQMFECVIEQTTKKASSSYMGASSPSA